jgi:hypothetical protein
MEVAGAKVIRLKNGRQLVIGLGTAALTDAKASPPSSAFVVADSKALAAVAKQRGVQVATEAVVRDRTVIKMANGKESGKSVSEVLSLTRAKAEAFIKGMTRVGAWRSKDRKTLYVALGVVLDAKGEPVDE